MWEVVAKINCFCDNNTREIILFCLQGIYYRMGDILARLHQWTEAEKFHKAALAVQSDHVPAHLSYGNMLARNVSEKNRP